jgi:hypothetical protein
MTRLETLVKKVEFCCPAEIPYGQRITILAEPIRSGDTWLVVAAEAWQKVAEIRLTQWLGEGEQLIVVGRKGKAAEGFWHIAFSAQSLEAASEEIERGVLTALGKTK